MEPLEAAGRDPPRLPAGLSAAAGLLLGALATGGCSTPRAVAAWVGSPLLQFAGADPQDGDCDEQPPHVAPAASSERLRIDRIFVPSGEPEFGLDPNFATVVPAGVASWDDFVERYSDHLLVVADVLITRDDD